MAIRLGSAHQRVYIVSVYYNTHLVATDQNEPDYRLVITRKANNADSPQEWRLVPSSDRNHFQIIHHHYNEPLIAAPDALAYDKDRRSVRTWIPGPSGRQCLWEIKSSPTGHFLIGSVEYGEYLYTMDDPSKNKVFTWRNQTDPSDKQSQWDIININ